LAGLSSTQYYNDYLVTGNTADDNTLEYAMHWAYSENAVLVDGHQSEELINVKDKLAAVHPIYVIPWAAALRCHELFKKTDL